MALHHQGSQRHLRNCLVTHSWLSPFILQGNERAGFGNSNQFRFNSLIKENKKH